MGVKFGLLTLKEEHTLAVFENRVLRRIFGLERDDEKLHNEELHDLYSLPNIIRIMKSRRMRWTRHVARMREKRNAYRLLMGKPEGKRPLGRPKHKWVDNIRIDLVEVGWDWSGSGWGQVESSCEFGIEPSGSMKCWETIECPNN
jgi:hypothetical protein